MRVVVQRVQNASVAVDGLVISAIGSGLLAWVGFGAQDNSEDLNYMVNTLLTTRFFHSERSAHRWTRSVMDCNYDVLVLSQLSLYSAMYLQKPYFYQAMNARRSKPFYDRFLKALRQGYAPDKIREGRFAAGYTVTTQTRGPVFIIESYNRAVNNYPGAPPPYPYPQPPVYGPPPPPPPPPRTYTQYRGHPPVAYSQSQTAVVNQSYQGLPPLRPMQPYPVPDYPTYPYY